MSLADWLQSYGDRGSWAKQPLEPFPAFEHRCVAAAWDYVERYTLHQVRRGIEVPPRIHWFRAIDSGWAEPAGMLYILTPDQRIHPDVRLFQLGWSEDPLTHCVELSEHYHYELEVFQQWPASRSLVEPLRRELEPLRERDPWYHLSEEYIAPLFMAMDVVSNAWAHRRYWFGL